MDYDRVKYHMYEDAQKKKVVRNLRLILNPDKRVVLALLFGSITRRRRVRDIDLAVYTFPPLKFDELLGMGARIESELGIPVDLVQLEDVDPSFRLRVLRHGVSIIKNELLRHRLLSEAFSELMDLRMSEKLVRKTQHVRTSRPSEDLPK